MEHRFGRTARKAQTRPRPAGRPTQRREYPVRDLALRFTWLLTKWGCVVTCYYCLLNGA